MTRPPVPRSALADPQLERRVALLAYAFASFTALATALWPGWAGLERGPLVILGVAGLLGSGLAALSRRPPRAPTSLASTSLTIATAQVMTTVSIFFAHGSSATGAYVFLYAVTAAHVAFLPSRRAVLAHSVAPFVGLPLALALHGDGAQAVGWLAMLPCTTVVPTLVVRTVLFAAGRRTSWDTSLDVPNRAGLLDLCADRLRGFAGAVEVCETVSVVHFDDLRELRLTLGADAAENVLAESAARLAQLPGAVVARTGLDALAVVRPVTTGTEGGSLETGRREGIALRSLLLDPVTLQGRGLGRGLRVRPETSVGVACVPDHGCDLEDLLAAADVALVTAATVPARVAVAEGAAILDVDALQLQTELPAAIADGQLRVYYQPLVASGTGRLLGSEALVRWQHPERGLLGPGAFIPLAERSQAIVALTYWVLGTAVAQCAQWRAAGYDLGVSVNVSANVLTEPSLIETVRRVIAEHRLEPSVLTVEVTESALLEDPVGAGAVLAALRAAGARVSLDDFGTGYTSLTMLRQLEVDELKIDRTFVEAASKAPADAAIVRALTDLAHRLSMEVVAEGIEDARTADLVMTLGVDVLQGFHYARPVPAEDLLTALRTPPSVPDTAPVVDSAPLEVEISAPRPADEAQRLALALRTRVRAQASLALLQKIVALAGEVCGTQFASLNIVDEDHVHLMAQLGHDLELTPRDGTPCSWVGTSRDVLVVPALDLDPRFAGGGMVAAGMHRYVGAPVLDVDGRPMAVLCVYDLAPEPETPQQVSALRSLAALAASHLDGADASDVLGRVHGVLQAMPQIDRAEDGCEVISVLTDTAWDLLRPDLLLLVRPATPFAKRWDLLGHRGHIDPDALAHVVFDVDDRSAVSRAVATQRAVWVPDATTSSLLDESLAVRLGAASVLSVPVVTTDGTQFVLSAVWRELQTDLHPALRDAVTALTARTAQYLDAARDEHLHADQPGVGHPRALAAT